MDTIALISSPEFWKMDAASAPALVLQNPRAPIPPPQDLQPGWLLFATSGSTGAPKWIVHTRATLLSSAAAVNRFLQATCKDRWACALPTFHVGGMGVYARAHLSGSVVIGMDGSWNAATFHRKLDDEQVTLTSLVPTQLHDLVTQQLRGPNSLRAVIIGGGALDTQLRSAALELGWPVLGSYGLTEAASQVATEDNTGRLRLLDIWETQLSPAGTLQLRGPALAIGVIAEGKFHPVAEDGWFTTTDRVNIVGPYLEWTDRADRTVKVLGELVDLSAIECQLSELAGHPVHVLALPDERRQHLLIATRNARDCLTNYNGSCAPFARIAGTFDDRLIQRSALGKFTPSATLAAVCEAGWTPVG